MFDFGNDWRPWRRKLQIFMFVILFANWIWSKLYRRIFPPQISLPVIDLSLYIDQPEHNQKQVIDQIEMASTVFGSFYVRHPLWTENNASFIFKRAAQFFSLDMKTKRSLQFENEGIARGYIGMVFLFAAMCFIYILRVMKVEAKHLK